MSKKVSKRPKKTQNYPKMDQIWKLVIEQNLKMKSYQSTLVDLKLVVSDPIVLLIYLLPKTIKYSASWCSKWKVIKESQ